MFVSRVLSLAECYVSKISFCSASRPFSYRALYVNYVTISFVMFRDPLMKW